MLTSLCAMSDKCHLRLLATSDFKLQRKTPMCFRNGTEKVIRVDPLAPADAAQLLFDNVSRHLTCGELGVTGSCSHSAKLEALQKHPAFLEAKGHPGTLVRGTPVVHIPHPTKPPPLSPPLTVPRSHWAEFQQRPDRLRRYSRASSNTSLASSTGGGCVGGSMFGLNGSTSYDFGRAQSPTSPIPPLTPAFSSDTRSHGGNPVFEGGGGDGGASEVSGGGDHFLLNGGGMGGPNRPGLGGSSRHSQYSPRPQQQQRHLRRLSQQQRRRAVQELLGADEHESPGMRPDEQRAFDTARDAGLNDTGCCLIWVQAVTNAAAHGWSCDRDDYPMAGGATSGLPDRVPWEYLSGSLKDHLCRKLTIPSSRGQVVDRDEMSFVRERLLRKQEQAWKASAGFRGSGRTERWPSGSVGVRAGGLDIGENSIDKDTISIEAFTEFSKWWAPLMTTLSRLRNDWSSTSPVRVHGFMGRQEACTKLEEQEVGTFLLRFSESVPGALVISFTEEVSRVVFFARVC
ncbi:unnamed protein product, partial [Laminaria digitata]